MSTHIIFIRHGELEGEDSSILHAAHDPVSLSEKGRETMVKLADDLGGFHIDKIYSSPEARTTESARILSERIAAPLEFREDLQGRSWGEFAGKSWSEVGRVLGSKSLEERYEFVPPAGESWKVFEERMLNAIRSICSSNEGKTVCIISHGSSIRVLLPKIFGVSVEESLKLYPDYGSISRVDHEENAFVRPIFNQKK